MCNEAVAYKVLAERALADSVDRGQAEGWIARRGASRPGVLTLEDLGIDRRRLSEARTLRNRHTDEDVERLCREATAAGQTLARQSFLRRVPHMYSQVTGFSEWYTPGPIVEKARAAMGGIDLDPASHAIPQQWIQAPRWYTMQDDGLSPDNAWFGRVLLNPPYSVPVLRAFVDRLFEEHAKGTVTQAVVLTNCIPETDVGQALLAQATAVCFPRRRLLFWTARDEAITTGSPVTSQMITYLGPDSRPFQENFRALGAVLKPCDG